MNSQKIFKTPSKTLVKMQIVHFGKILFNLQFIVLAIMLASIVSFILPAIYYLFLVFILCFSFFTLFANPTFMSLWSGGETLTKVASSLTHSWQYTIPIAAVLSIASIVCLCFDKNIKHIARILISLIILVFAVIILFFKLVNSGVFK